MKILIDFSIFESPIHAFGNITGKIDVPFFPEIGNELVLLRDAVKLKVISIAKSEGDPEEVIVGLEDIILTSKHDAEELAQQMESQLGLFCVRYEDL